MTIVKKAKKLLATADNGSKECKIYNDGFLDGAEWGYKEAMRWRDVEEELPEDGVLVQVKYRDSFNEENVNYEHNAYYAVHKIWDIEQYACIKVTHWRPIE